MYLGLTVVAAVCGFGDCCQKSESAIEQKLQRQKDIN